MLSAMLAAVLLAGPPREKPMALDPVTQRRAYEAWMAAREWVRDTTNDLYHWTKAMRYDKEGRRRFYATKTLATRYLSAGAAKQICEAYGIGEKDLESVVADPRSRTLRFVEEPVGEAAGVRMARSLRSIRYPTRFDPSKVVIPEKQAKEIGYTNPGKDEPSRYPTPKMYMPDGRRIPGAPRDPEQEARRSEIERRAREARIKERPIAVQKPSSGNSVNAP